MLWYRDFYYNKMSYHWNGSLYLKKELKALLFFKNKKIRFLNYFLKTKSSNRNKTNNIFFEITKASQREGKYYRYRNFFLNAFWLVISKYYSSLNWWDNEMLDKKNIFLFVLNYYFSNINIFFKFEFHLIDKNKRKFSRGKSGKYRIVYSYIPEFKRIKNLIKLFLKELRTLYTLKYQVKWAKLLYLYLFNFKKTKLYNQKMYTANYIFKHKYDSLLINSK